MLVKSFTAVRRSGKVATLVIVGLLLALCAGFFTWAPHAIERIRHYGVDVAVQEDGSALVRETIDYDFGYHGRHGIFRYVSGYELKIDPELGGHLLSDIRVLAASAPAEFAASEGLGSADIKIGNADETVSGLHRYVIEYRISDVVSGDRLAYDAVGTGWEVSIDEVDVRMTAPYRVGDVNCFRGDEGSTAACETVGADGDAVTAHVDDLDDEQGVTIAGTRAGALSGPARTALAEDADLSGGDDGRSFWTTIWLVLGWGALGYVLGVVALSVWSRRAGRDQAWAGGGIDAVFGGPDLPSAPISDREAERQVTMQFEPPTGLTPAQGGILLQEKVEQQHQVAWLTQQSLAGFVEIGDDGKELTRTTDEEKWAKAPAPLARMFKKRTSFQLGTFDSKFAAGFGMVGNELRQWRAGCDLWDHFREERNAHRTTRLKWLGALGALMGAVLLIAFGSIDPKVAYLAGGLSGLLLGTAFGAGVHTDELPVRTQKGFALRQLAEGFRRFFAASEGRHAREAAERGELRLYSAWAVALGELDRWNAAMATAALPPSTAGVSDTTSYVALSSSVSTATTAPSSNSGSSSSYSGGGYSGGGYSGGGSVGGGAGGGGGGSW